MFIASLLTNCNIMQVTHGICLREAAPWLVSPERVVIKVKVATSCKIWPQLNLMVII